MNRRRHSDGINSPATVMPYLDTHRHDSDLADIDPHRFDVIQLMSRHGNHFGEDVWYRSRLVANSPRGAVTAPPIQRRLLVHVADEQSPNTARRIRIELGLTPDLAASA